MSNGDIQRKTKFCKDYLPRWPYRMPRNVESKFMDIQKSKDQFRKLIKTT